MIDKALLQWEARLLGNEGFQSIAAPHDTKLNQKAPALKTPKAVRAADVLKLAPEQFTEPSPAMVLKADESRAVVLHGQGGAAPYDPWEEAEMELKTISLGEPPAKRRKFFLDESHAEDPDPAETGTKIHSQAWVWGGLILLLLVVVTFRHRL